MVDTIVIAATTRSSMQPGHNGPIWADRSETELECTSEISFSPVEGHFLDPAKCLQFGDISGNLPFGDVQERSDVLIGHITFLSVLRKAVDLQEQNLGVPIYFGIQVDYFGYPYTLKISVGGFHSFRLFGAVMMFSRVCVCLFLAI